MNTEKAELFRRHPSNPILTADNWPYAVNTVFNPGATLLPNGDTLLLVRCEDFRGFSHLTIARSKDGISNWKIDTKPVASPFSRFKDGDAILEPDESERWGVEDPRITYLEEIKQYAITYTAYSSHGPEVSLMTTPDFKTFKRIGPIFPPDNKDAALFPRKINDKWSIIHRPQAPGQDANIWMSTSSDLIKWGGHKVLLQAREEGWWDAKKIGLSPPPIETKEGWLIIYHGVRKTACGKIYRVGLALVDLENPLKLLRRSDNWVFGPKEHYEREGDVDDVVFPTGWVLNKKDKSLRMYYGAADTCIGVVTANLDELVKYIMDCPK